MGTIRKTVTETETEQERTVKIEALRRALIEGERSGEPQSFDFAAFTRRKIAQHGG